MRKVLAISVLVLTVVMASSVVLGRYLPKHQEDLVLTGTQLSSALQPGEQKPQSIALLDCKATLGATGNPSLLCPQLKRVESLPGLANVAGEQIEASENSETTSPPAKLDAWPLFVLSYLLNLWQ